MAIPLLLAFGTDSGSRREHHFVVLMQSQATSVGVTTRILNDFAPIECPTMVWQFFGNYPTHGFQPSAGSASADAAQYGLPGHIPPPDVGRHATTACRNEIAPRTSVRHEIRIVIGEPALLGSNEPVIVQGRRPGFVRCRPTTASQRKRTVFKRTTGEPEASLSRQAVAAQRISAAWASAPRAPALFSGVSCISIQHLDAVDEDPVQPLARSAARRSRRHPHRRSK